MKIRGLVFKTAFVCLIAISGAINLAAAPGDLQLSWQSQFSGTKASLRGVCAVSPEIAWASGANGTVLKTVNGGKNWQLLTVPGADSLDFRDIQAFDADTAIVLSAGSPALVYKTANGGRTWKETYRNNHKGIFFDSMAFWDNKNGIAFSDPVDGAFFVMISEDGGESWHRVPPNSLPAPGKGEAGFAASGTCLTVQGKSNAWFCTGGGTARVIYTTDKGKTWHAANTPLASGEPSQGGFSIVFKDAKNGVITGGDYKNETASQNNAAYTGDGGKTWFAVSGQPPAGFRECAVYVPLMGDSFVITVGPSGSDVSINGGKTWRPFSNQGYHSVSLAPRSGVLFAVGAEGKIARLDCN
jgi:photosystem II stability/assembly factor-like uncharacterized protein